MSDTHHTDRTTEPAERGRITPRLPRSRHIAHREWPACQCVDCGEARERSAAARAVEAALERALARLASPEYRDCPHCDTTRDDWDDYRDDLDRHPCQQIEAQVDEAIAARDALYLPACGRKS
jgi:hypothetical protein